MRMAGVTQVTPAAVCGLNVVAPLAKPESPTTVSFVQQQSFLGGQPLRYTLGRSDGMPSPEGRYRRRKQARAQVSAPVHKSFAEEQDYVRKGGVDWPLVTRQARKRLPQPKIASTLNSLEAGAGILDLVVVGCGPAGLALASEAAKLGIKVGLIGPDVPFVNNYGVWLDEFQRLGLEHCLDCIWRDASVFLEGDKPKMVGRAYGRVGRELLREELLKRCKDAGVVYLDAEVEEIEDLEKGSVVLCSGGKRLESRLVTVAAGAAAGKFVKYEPGGLGVGVQTAYGIEVEVEYYPFDSDVMHFMDFRHYNKGKEAEEPTDFIPTFLYAMPLSTTKVFFEETCLAARPAMTFEELKRRLWVRLEGLGIKVKSTDEEEWSYIPVGGTLPVTTQQHLAFGASASMIHPATGYSIVRSISEAPHFAAEIAAALKQESSEGSARRAAIRAWNVLWSPERKRQTSFFVFGLELIMQMDTAGTRDFFLTFFRLPERMWKGFLGSNLSSLDLITFALTTFVIAPNSLRFRLVEHLIQHPSGSKLVSVYTGFDNLSEAKLRGGATIAATAFVATVAIMAGMMLAEGR